MGEQKFGKMIINDKIIDIDNVSMTELETIRNGLEQRQDELETKINKILDI